MIESIKSSDNNQWLLKSKRKSSLPIKSFSSDTNLDCVKQSHLNTNQFASEDFIKKKVKFYILNIKKFKIFF